MSRLLLSALRNLAQDCETIAAAARKAIKEIEGAELLGAEVNEALVEKSVRRLERRLTQAAHRVGITRR